MTASSVVIRTSAPVRLDFAGAWTDVAPFAQRECGAVVNAAINLRTRVELTAGQSRYSLRADDLDQQVDVDTLGDLRPDGTLDLLKAAIRRAGLAPCTLRTSAEAPPGSGLGSSGALSVALTAATGAARGEALGRVELAHEAWLLETVDAAVPGGQQDQYAASVGGFQHISFDRGVTTTRSLDIDPAFAEELAAHTVVCFTGRSRFSGDTISRVMRAYADGDQEVTGALRAMADLAGEMAIALEQSQLERVGALLARNWTEQQRLAPGMCTGEMKQLEQAMARSGAIGGKAAGAGAGGSMFFVVAGDPTEARAAAVAAGTTILPTVWADRGASID